MLPQDKQSRKERPMARGFLDYFPKAMAEVAHISYIANEQHNPGEPMHWSKNKSADHADALVRHLAERGGIDTDGLLHTAKVAWRGMALLETELDTLTKQEHEALAKGRERTNNEGTWASEKHPYIPSDQAWDALVDRVQAQADEALLTSESPAVAVKGEWPYAVLMDTQEYPANAATLGDLAQVSSETPEEWVARQPWYTPPSLWERIRAFVAHTFIALAFRIAPVDAWNAAQTESEMLYDSECSDEGF